MRSKTFDHRDLHRTVTETIVAQLEAGTAPRARPWSTGRLAGPISRPLRVSGQPYRGINVLMLWLAAAALGYASPTWMTFKQALELGGCVRRGEKASPATFADRRWRLDEATQEECQVVVLRSYQVFNVEQIDGLPGRCYGQGVPIIAEQARIAACERFFGHLGVELGHAGASTHYDVVRDVVRMPPFVSRSPLDDYATLGHECIDWTRGPGRLEREFRRQRRGDAGYTLEELVAEVGAAFLGADLGLEPTPHEDHARTIASWIEVLKRDSRAIFTAAGHAQRAVDFLQVLQPDGEMEAGKPPADARSG